MLFEGKKRRRKTKSKTDSTSGDTDKKKPKRRKKRRVTKKRTSRKRVKKEDAEDGSVRTSSRLGRHAMGSASLEPTLSFNIFGNKYDLDEFQEPPASEEPKKKEAKK